MMTIGRRHRAQHRLRPGCRPLPFVAAVELRTIGQVLLEDGGWYVVVNNSFSVARLKFTDRSQTTDMGDGFYFYDETGARVAGQLTSIRAVRQDPALMFAPDEELDLLELLGNNKP